MRVADATEVCIEKSVPALLLLESTNRPPTQWTLWISLAGLAVMRSDQGPDAVPIVSSEFGW